MLKIGAIAKYSDKLDKKEKELIEEYIVYRKARGLNGEDSYNHLRRVLGQMRYALNKPFKQMDLKDMRELLSLIVSEDFTANYKNNLKATLKNFLKFVFPDWSMRFSNLEDIKFTTGSFNEEKINHQTLFTKEDIERCVDAEPTNYWKAFLLTQYEAGLRTKEIRLLKWDDIKLDIEDGLTELNIYATKTHKARTVYVQEATKWIKRLKQEQEKSDNKGVYIFHSKRIKDKPIEKDKANNWFKTHTKKVLKRDCWNYLLRHSRATELYNLAEQNKISKDTAIKFMGHSEDMSRAYNHPNPADVKKMLREQVYNIADLPPERKHELEIKYEELQKKMVKMAEDREKEKQELREYVKKIMVSEKLKIARGV